jgi:cytochrome oxidase Cu insertion factor (SCO1/SenC/PrrC family)
MGSAMKIPQRVGLILLVALALAGMLSAQRDYALAKPQKQWKPGEQAPAFVLKDQDGTEVRLADLRGRRVILMFYRGHW